MLNILSFTYMHPLQINRAAQVLLLGPEALKELSDRYVLVNHIENNTVHDCPIHEILYDDFIQLNKETNLEILHELENKYPRELFDQIFPRNNINIKRKIINTINFTIDQVYKCDKLCVTFSERMGNAPIKQGVPNAIYEVLQEEFNILDSSSNCGLYSAIICKRREENG